MVAKEPFQIRPITQKIIFCRNHEKVIHFTKPNRKVNIHKIFSIFARRKSRASRPEQTIEKLIILRGYLEVWHGNVARCDNESDHVSNLKKLSVKARNLWNSLVKMTCHDSTMISHFSKKYSVANDYPIEIPSLETCFTYRMWHTQLFTNAQKQNAFFEYFVFSKNTEMQKLLKHSRWLLKIVRWAEYDAKDGEN